MGLQGGVVAESDAAMRSRLLGAHSGGAGAATRGSGGQATEMMVDTLSHIPKPSLRNHSGHSESPARETKKDETFDKLELIFLWFAASTFKPAPARPAASQGSRRKPSRARKPRISGRPADLDPPPGRRYGRRRQGGLHTGGQGPSPGRRRPGRRPAIRRVIVR